MALESRAVPTGRTTPYSPRPFPTADGAVARRAYAVSTIGTKVILAVTGLALFLFLPIHLVGNLLLLVGSDTFNRYARSLESIPVLVPVAEVGLLALFVIHASKAVLNFLANRRARGSNYAAKRPATGGASRKTWASASMIVSGITIGVFVPVHLLQMKFGAYYPVTLDGAPARDLYRLVRELFHDPFVVAFYVFCMVVVGAHIYHGFASAFQSLGAYHPRYAPLVLLLGRGLGVVIGAGFLALPLVMYAAR